MLYIFLGISFFLNLHLETFHIRFFNSSFFYFLTINNPLSITFRWIIEKARAFQKKIYFYFIDYAKAFDCVDQKLWKILKEMGIPDHLTCLLRNLYTGQEATVRARRGTTDWFQIRKGIHQGCILSPHLFNLYVEYLMRNAGLDEAQAGIKDGREKYL